MNTAAARDTLTKYLKENKLRITRERFELLDEIMSGSGHFDAEELFSIARAKGLKASRATIYNSLDIFASCGLVSRYRFGDSHYRYEKAFGRPRHDHLICLKCGEIVEFVNRKLEKIQEEVCQASKFRFQSSTLQIFGLCSKCQENE